MIYDDEGKNIGITWLELFNYKYHSGLVGFNPYIWNENRLVEIFQSLLLFFTIIINIKIIRLIKKRKSYKFFIYLLYLYLVCIFYFFLEEISWGQHLFKWESNNFFLTHNNQGETNIHNISNLFDQLPRSLLVLWCGFSLIIQSFVAKIIPNKIYSKLIPLIGKKIVEEAAEVWMACEYQSKDEAAEEISQLFYHLQVMMIDQKLELEDIYKFL